jgi:hypothetical protein
MLRTVYATRYVTPLREGGSLPAIVEADDLGMYVLKFRGAGQGPLALVAELLAGELGRVLGLNVPELVFVLVDDALARNEPDPEIRDLLRASVGLNLGLDYLPGSIMFDAGAGHAVDPDLASRAVWFDAYITNVDRTAYNPNLLYWHRSLYFIDHGAALYFHHDWPTAAQLAESPFVQIRRHVLLPWAERIELADRSLRPLLTPTVLDAIVAQIPDAWLVSAQDAETPAGRRTGYTEYLRRRLKAAPIFAQEAQRARAELV